MMWLLVACHNETAARGLGSKNVPRWMAMYLRQELSAVILLSVATPFSVSRCGTASTTDRKLKQGLAANPARRIAFEKLAMH